MDRAYLTTIQVAALLGVGPTTIKRWVAQGLLPEVRTVGHHRRFRREDVEAFLARRHQLADSTPEVDRWIQLLLGQPRMFEIQQALFWLRSETSGWWVVCELLGRVLDEVGRRWASGRLTIAREHWISGRLAGALAGCSASIPVPAGGPRAVLAAAEGEEHTLGLSLAEPCLLERGWRTECLGRFIPTPALIERVREGGLAMMGLSASAHSSDREHLSRQLRQLVPVCRQTGVHVLLGGRGAWPHPFDHTHRVTSLEDLGPTLDRIESRIRPRSGSRRRARSR